MTLLAIDTSGSVTRVAVGDLDGGLRRELRAPAGRDAGTGLPGLLAALAGEMPGGLRTIAAIGVATGPGSFTGLRVGLAVAKTLAWDLAVPLAGIRTGDALRRAAVGRAGAAAAACAVIRPAGVRERTLDLPDADPVVLSVDGDPRALLAGRPALAVGAPAPVDLPCLPGWTSAALGAAAEEDVAGALLRILAERRAAERMDDVATLGPLYVTAPRGAAAMEVTRWSPDLA